MGLMVSRSVMRIADFLYRRFGLNIYKAAPNLRAHPLEQNVPAPSQNSSEEPEPEAPIQPAASPSEVIHIGPRGGRYKVDSKGRKIYLKAG